jgi:hypothetical protein
MAFTQAKMLERLTQLVPQRQKEISISVTQ